MDGRMTIVRANGWMEVRHFTEPVPLAVLQDAVGGWIRQVPHFRFFNGADCVAFCNDDGQGLPVNDFATEAWNVTGRTLAGDVAIMQGDVDFMDAL